MLEFKKINFSHKKLLILLIIINFIVISFPLFLYPPPQNLYPDSASHYKITELIKEDITNINYNPGYRKGFHLITAFVSNLIPIGYAMALIISFFTGLLIFYSFRLSFLLTQNKITSLFSALIVSSITVFSDVGSIPSPVPQTIGLSLGIIAVYYFFRENWIKAGLSIAFYSIMHSSYIFFLGLMALISVYEIFRKNQSKKLMVFGKTFAFIISTALLTAIISFSGSIPFVQLSPAIGILDVSVSPLSLLEVTFPFGMILIALIGVYFNRKKIPETHYFGLLLWFIIPVLGSQAYWLNLQFFPSSRALIFMLFPLAFFSAKLTELTENKKILSAAGILILLVSFTGHFYFYEELPKNDFKKIITKEEKEAIEFLKTKPENKIVLAQTEDNDILTLAHKNNSTQRNLWLVLAKKNVNELLDMHSIDYILVDKKNFENTELIEGTIKEFENKEFIVFKINNEIRPEKTEKLEDYVLALVAFWDPVSEIKSNEIKFMKITAEDTKEEICLAIYNGLKISGCPEKIDFEVAGKKEVLTELLNSYEKTYFYRKAGYLIRNKQLEIYPNEITFIEKGPYDIKKLSYIYQWTNNSKYSEKNLIIGKLFWKLGLR